MTTTNRMSDIALPAAGRPDVAASAESSFAAWFAQTRALSARQLWVLFHEKSTFIQVFLMPVLTTVMLKVVLGEAIGRATGQDAAYGTVPLVIVVSAMFGSVVAGVRLNLERTSGLLSRLYVLPINRAADLSSRLVCEIVRMVLTTTVLITVGWLVGFRMNPDPWAILGIYGVAIGFGIAFASIVLALAVNFAPGAPLVPLLSLVSSVLMFFNTGFAPASEYPGWLEPIVANQPMSPAIEVMRALAAGGPITENLIKVILWTVGTLAVCLYPALRGYRKAATAS
ncbi:ABC transporter permease [Gordonia sp. NPDC003376]